MICCSARTIGPAAGLALSGASSLRVHSVFRSSLNLAVEGGERLVSLRGPDGGGLPHEVVLDRPEAFDEWPIAVGSCASVSGDAIRVPVDGGELLVDLRNAVRLPARALPSIPRPGAAHRACVERLSKLQRSAGCELRIEALGPGPAAITAVGVRLREAALALGEAVRDGAQPRPAGAALIGLGPGLTPSGDDFLCGFLAAVLAAHPALLPALHQAAAASLGRTGGISAFLLRCAIEGFWPASLVDLADALAADQEPDALRALAELCQLGHSSGCDLATGFLYGLGGCAGGI
jgi:hypothetical protein